jgi:branched-subunit amino acid transport protein AzlD
MSSVSCRWIGVRSRRADACGEGRARAIEFHVDARRRHPAQIRQLSGRDLQLWSIGILVILTLTAGLLAFITPNLMRAQRVVRIAHAYLPQLVYGLISLIVLFNIYLLSQKNTLNATRHALIRELVLTERLQSLSLMNPLTQLPKSARE